MHAVGPIAKRAFNLGSIFEEFFFSRELEAKNISTNNIKSSYSFMEIVAHQQVTTCEPQKHGYIRVRFS